MLVVIWRDQSTGYATLSTALHTQELSLTLEKLVNQKKYYFLSRPRRFAKSLLLDTLRLPV
ncbi:AAA family ATPase [Vreelandella aquamarina]|jgi:hypothetical protein|uniref:AAA family ATPase n=1 Tax=Vreelandella aquamarina TaxID=77097 RepID=UPI000940EF0C|nr:AAA family ATPase [Halomonas meridiana]